jgi:hypothetical protein
MKTSVENTKTEDIHPTRLRDAMTYAFWVQRNPCCVPCLPVIDGCMHISQRNFQGKKRKKKGKKGESSKKLCITK